MEARLEDARIPIQVDIGFGHAVTPDPEEVQFPVLLDLPAPRLRSYPIYTVIAEQRSMHYTPSTMRKSRSAPEPRA
jgi:hypothetical protein